MARVWTVWLAMWLALGCHTGEEPARGAHRGVDPPVTYSPRPEASKAPIDTPYPPEPELDVPAPDRRAEEGAERDLDAELRAALGVPIDCVRDYSGPTPTTLRISVGGIVRPTGMIIEPSAYGTGLSPAALQCIRQRITAVVLRPLDDTVSQRAATVIEIEYQPEVVLSSEPGVPEPVLRNVKDPLPKRPEVAPSGRPIQEPKSKPISGGFDGGRPIQEPTSRKIKGPKPRAIDGYQVDENAQEWR